MSLSAKDFRTILESAEHSAVHLELRDSYGTSEESGDFARWQRTGVSNNDPDSDFWAEWTNLVRPTVARGVVMQRLRIVSEPVSEYIRYEYAGTAVNLAIGEDVRWLPRKQASDLALPGNDFWLIDDEIVQWNYFTGDGDSAGHENTDEPGVVALCSTAFKSSWTRAIPHAQYKI